MKKLWLVLMFVALLGGMVMSAAEPESESELEWLTDAQKATELAKAMKRPILIFFTGSDWCGYCMKFKAETLSSPEFNTMVVEGKVVLLYVDFPRGITQSEGLIAQNNKLKEQYEVQGFPTVIVLGSEGKELVRVQGYYPKDMWLSWFNRFVKNELNTPVKPAPAEKVQSPQTAPKAK